MNTPHSNQEDEIDLIALLASLYQKKRFILKTVVGFMIIGLFVALVSPTIYKAQAIFVVQNSDKQVSSSISGLAALAGVNLQSEAMGDIPPSLYPNIVSVKCLVFTSFHFIYVRKSSNAIRHCARR